MGILYYPNTGESSGKTMAHEMETGMTIWGLRLSGLGLGKVCHGTLYLLRSSGGL